MARLNCRRASTTAVRRASMSAHHGDSVNGRGHALEYLTYMRIGRLPRLHLQVLLNGPPQMQYRLVGGHRERLVRDDDLERRFQDRARRRYGGWRIRLDVGERAI